MEAEPGSFITHMLGVRENTVHSCSRSEGCFTWSSLVEQGVSPFDSFDPFDLILGDSQGGVHYRWRRMHSY